MTEFIECLLCEKAFSELDIYHLDFFPQTRICYKCYRKMQKSNFDASCFGKKSVGAHLGFDINSQECRALCPDRKICPHFANGAYIKLHKKLKQPSELIKVRPVAAYDRKFPYPTGCNLDKVFRLCMEGITKKRLLAWCKRKGKNINFFLRTLKKNKHAGKEWLFKNDGTNLSIRYPL